MTLEKEPLKQGPVAWHNPQCEGQCLACLIDETVLTQFGTIGLAYLHERIATLKPDISSPPPEPKGLFIDMIAAQDPEFVEEMKRIGAADEKPQPEPCFGGADLEDSNAYLTYKTPTPAGEVATRIDADSRTIEVWPAAQPVQEPSAMRNFVRKVLEQGSMLAVYHRYANPVAYSDQLDGLAFNLAKTAPPQPKPLTLDCIGLALDLEKQAKRVESQTVERAMYAAAHGLRLIEVTHNTGAKP